MASLVQQRAYLKIGDEEGTKLDIDFRTYRVNDIDSKLRKAHLFPLDILVAGVTGAGKSTTLNALLQRPAARVGEGVAPETMDTTSYRLNRYIRMWDTPGLGDSVRRDKLHKKKIADLLSGDRYTWNGSRMTRVFIDLVLVIIEGSSRDMGVVIDLFKKVLIPNIQYSRILVAVNQADIAMKGAHWNKDTQTPDPQLIAFLEAKSDSIQQRIRNDTGFYIHKPVYYSAKYGYNLQALFDLMIDHMPWQRRNV